jgi:hypothetical protein
MELAATLLRAAAARVVDDEAAHDAGGVAHEARFVGKRGVAASGDLEIRLVQQRCRAERRGRAARELALREAVQLGVQGFEQPLGCSRVALFRRRDERGERGRRGARTLPVPPHRVNGQNCTNGRKLGRSVAAGRSPMGTRYAAVTCDRTSRLIRMFIRSRAFVM